MRVDRGEVELAGVQEDHGADGGGTTPSERDLQPD